MLQGFTAAAGPNKEVTWLMKRRNAALVKKQMFGSLFQKAYRLSQPNRNIFDMRPIGQNPSTFNVQGIDIAWYVFDLTLAHATDTWVNEIVNALCPAGKNWFKFVSGTKISEEQKDDVNKQLKERTEIFFHHLHKSNFQPVVTECFYDVAVSTGFMTINEGPDKSKPWIFCSNPPDAIYAEEGPYGVYDSYFRDWTKLKLEVAQVMWPKLEIPNRTQKENEDNIDEKLITLYEMLYYDYETERWEYRVIHPDTQSICFRRTDSSSPFVGWRVKKLSGETYGRGPAMDAMAASGTINQALYDEIVSANFMALPMYMGFEDGVFNPNNFQMIPNTILACAPTASGTWPLQPVPAAGNIQWSMLILDELRTQIHDIMHTSPLPPEDSPKATATEILKRDQKNIDNRAAQYARIQQEFFGPFVTRCIDLLRKKGIWDDIKVDGEVIKIEFDTPLVSSQGQKDVIDLMQHVQVIQSIYGPEATSGFYRTEKLSPWIAQKLGTNSELVKTENELLQMMQEVQDKQQQMMEAQNGQGQPALPAPQEGQEV